MQLFEFHNLVDSRTRTRASICPTDSVVLALILLIGAIQFIYYPHTADFVNDPGYPDMARSILEHSSYDFDYLPETTLPPGFPLILVLAGRFFGLGPAVLFRVIAVFTTLGLIVTYQLVRQVEGRGAAAAACLLLGSSPALFRFNTGVIFPEMPYFFLSIVVLLLTLRIDRMNSGRTRIAWPLALSVALILAVLVRSIGIALLIALGTWIVVSLVVVPEIGRRRLRKFLLPLLLGATAQVGWSVWAHRHEVLEWHLPGYPESYVSQLKVKNGQYPELGLARLSDIPARVGQNIVARTALLGQLLTQRYISTFWSSPGIVGVLILVALGLASSLRTGGQLHDWYFLWYELIFWFWPWDTKSRFLFPVMPLAVLYLWRGAKMVTQSSMQHPKLLGRCVFLVASVLGMISAAFAARLIHFDIDPGHARGDNLQPIAAAAFWTALAATGFGLVRIESVRRWMGSTRLAPYLGKFARSHGAFASRAFGTLVLAVLVGSGVVQQLALGRNNLNIDIKRQSTYPEIAASEWIQTHEPPDRIIMARDQDMVFHYTGRRVVWFPPISDPSVLMDGIRRHNVSVVVVAHHPDSYWLPLEDVCFQSLLDAYHDTFQIVNRGPDYQVFEVLPRQTPSGDGGLAK
jgi:hypothetical protein